MSITQERMEKALEYLATTDEPFAEAKSLMEGKAKQEKTVLGLVFLRETGTKDEREYQARVSDSYHTWKREYEAAVLDFELYKNRRITATLLSELWRSLNSNRRQAGGNL